MRFTAILAALAVTATAVPTSNLEQAAATIEAQAAACKHLDQYQTCTANCSGLAPGFACALNCLIAFCA
ncbi:hypothetical protein K505DRAFT_356667 [Melanomma pulvis-pyrius CBS 109.77]|uniref:Uncharacterized protein n=1 Tax=Melanomma pulvis-pyrius CBS 109.77 TaxID=1314802 RepID=A0A6A6XV26_9PLEO|nr:hypothetical protein K505DRAFT_356667 [Melanomma pulvis-pyrius CBS 109.77]